MGGTTTNIIFFSNKSELNYRIRIFREGGGETGFVRSSPFISTQLGLHKRAALQCRQNLVGGSIDDWTICFFFNRKEDIAQ